MSLSAVAHTCEGQAKRGGFWCRFCPPERKKQVQIGEAIPPGIIIISEGYMETNKQAESAQTQIEGEDNGITREASAQKQGTQKGPRYCPDIPCDICGALSPKTLKSRLSGQYLCPACFMLDTQIRNHPLHAIVKVVQQHHGNMLAEGLGGQASQHTGIIDKKQEIERGSIYSTNPQFDAILQKMGQLHDAKRNDYASNSDPLGNFREAERLGISAYQSIMIRMTDKYTRACNLTRKQGEHSVADESLADTLLDLANYAVLALIALKEE